MAFYCSIKSALFSVNFDSDIDLYPYFASQRYNKYMPDFSVSRLPAPTKFTVVYRNGQDRTVVFEDNNAYICYPWDMMREGESILYLGYPLIEAQNQSAGICTVHSASFVKENKGILLFGDAGSGKTSVVIQVCKGHDGKLISNDLTVVGSSEGVITAYGGTKFFHIRKTSVDQNMPWLSKFFKEEASIDPWVDKIFVTAEELDIPVHNGPVSISAIYRIHVDNRMNSVIYKPQQGSQMKLFLNEQLSRFIRNVTTAVMVGSEYEIVAPVPSLDNEERFTRRIGLINAMIENVGITCLSGPLNLVINHISAML